MTALAINLEELHEPTTEERAAASTAARALSRLSSGSTSIRIQPEREEGQAEEIEPITLPANIFRVLIKLLVEMGNGNAVAIVPVSAELTTQQAADLMNVSRPHLISLLDKGELNFRMVGTHRKLKARDVLAYNDKAKLARRGHLEKMVELDQADGLYDDEPVAAKE